MKRRFDLNMKSSVLINAARDTSYILVTMNRARHLLSGEAMQANRAGVLRNPAAALAQIKKARLLIDMALEVMTTTNWPNQDDYTS